MEGLCMNGSYEWVGSTMRLGLGHVESLGELQVLLTYLHVADSDLSGGSN